MDTQDAAAIVDSVFAEVPEMALVPGIAYGLVQGDRLVHAGGRGCLTIGGEPPSDRTIFRIASMTKSFTAAAILILRDEGRLRLDDPLADHLPVAHTIGAPARLAITIRDLLTMGAGLATDDPWGDRQESLPESDFDALVAAGLSFCWPPRTTFEYSNTGYALLGRVIESVTGQSYRDVVREGICSPLGLTDTTYRVGLSDGDRTATGYRRAADGSLVAEPIVAPGAYSAMGGLHSTIADLAVWVGGFISTWAQAQAAHPVDRWSLREAQELARFVELRETTGTAAGPSADGYGFGLVVHQHKNLGRLVSHSGGYPGFGSHMRWHPASGWGLIALGNCTYAPMHIPVAEALARLVTQSEADDRVKPTTRVVPWPQTVAAMDISEHLMRGDDSGLTDSVWSPNMDLDIPRAERMAALALVRAALGDTTRVESSVQFPSPARATWTIRGDAGSARLELWMTPERLPRIQKLIATELSDSPG